MADLDPLRILNSEVQVGPDGVSRRANEKVTRHYMQFGKCLKLFLFHVFLKYLLWSIFLMEKCS